MIPFKFGLEQDIHYGWRITVLLGNEEVSVWHEPDLDEAIESLRNKVKHIVMDNDRPH